MRRRLNDYRLLNKEIDNDIERLERLQMKAYAPSSPNLTGMPKAPSSTFDRLADIAAKIADLQTEIDSLMKERDQERHNIEDLVKMLPNPDERAVIRLRYLDSEEWVDIIVVLFGYKDDYDDKYDNYKQRVFRLHSSAVSKLSEM